MYFFYHLHSDLALDICYLRLRALDFCYLGLRRSTNIWFLVSANPISGLQLEGMQSCSEKPGTIMRRKLSDRWSVSRSIRRAEAGRNMAKCIDATSSDFTSGYGTWMINHCPSLYLNFPPVWASTDADPRSQCRLFIGRS
jgi:hypothetical protein